MGSLGGGHRGDNYNDVHETRNSTLVSIPGAEPRPQSRPRSSAVGFSARFDPMRSPNLAVPAC